jgi:hypothetical protein
MAGEFYKVEQANFDPIIGAAPAGNDDDLFR